MPKFNFINTPDITTLPDIQMDFSGIYESFQQLAEHTGFTGTDWGSWINTQSPPKILSGPFSTFTNLGGGDQ